LEAISVRRPIGPSIGRERLVSGRRPGFGFNFRSTSGG
jgi:hypothetical protein